MKLADILDLDAVTPKEARRVRKIYERAVSLGAVKAYIPLISNALIGCESNNFASDYSPRGSVRDGSERNRGGSCDTDHREPDAQ